MVRATILFVLLVGCSGAATRMPSPQSCDAAPRWLVQVIQSGVTTKGATVADAYVAPASDLSGLPGFADPRWDHATWVLARISGTRGKDVLGIWLTNGLDESDPGLLFAVNAGARKHSSWGADIDAAIGGHGTEARSCVGLD
jgi:hypothetical protein